MSVRVSVRSHWTGFSEILYSRPVLKFRESRSSVKIGLKFLALHEDLSLFYFVVQVIAKKKTALGI